MKRKPTIWSKYLINGTVYPEFPECSVYEFLEKQTKNSLDRVAIEFEGRKTTYGEFIDLIDKVSNSLIANGIGKGDIVSIISPNLPQAIATVYAVNKVGAVANMLHPLLPPAELKQHVEKTESKMVFILDQFYGKIGHVEWSIPAPIVVLFAPADALGFPKKLFVKRVRPKVQAGTVLLWKDFLNKRVENPVYEKGDPESVAFILYSGGTTGEQKGVCLTNWNIVTHTVQGHEIGECIPYTRTLAVMPIFHGFGLCSSINSMLTCSSHLFLLASYDPVKCNKLIFKKRIETIFAIPAIYDALIRSDEMRTKDYSFLKYMFCGGDKLKPQTERVFREYMEKIGSDSRIMGGYGLTECVAGCISNALFVTKEGTAGMAFPDTEIKIVTPGTEEELPAGSVGELCVCSPSVMKGYYKNEKATAEALRKHADGKTWLHTGDAFSVDEEGFYTFHSRLSRMLVVNGYNVYPESVENALMQIDGVTKACSVGLPGLLGGDRVAAAVCLDDKHREMSTEEIKDKLRDLLPGYAMPYKIVVMERLPATKVGKVDFMKVAEMIGEA